LFLILFVPEAKHAFVTEVVTNVRRFGRFSINHNQDLEEP
jgi:hypothetical protein